MSYTPDTAEVSDEQVIAEVLVQLGHLRGLVCDDCRTQIIDRVMETLMV